MRVVGDIAHQYCKITIFQTTSRFSVKFEQGVFEQTYKFRIGDAINTVNDVKKIVTETFIQQVIDQFHVMGSIKEKAFSQFMTNALDEFDEIY